MAPVNLPRNEPPQSVTVDLLRVRLDAILEPKEYKILNSTLAPATTKGSEPGKHAAFRKAVEFQGQKAELAGIIGLHDNRGTAKHKKDLKADQADTGLDLHYDISLRRGKPRPDMEDGDWESLVKLAAPMVAELELGADLWFRTPREGTTLAVSLPISLEGSGVAGFSEIAGVQLVRKATPESADSLYSAILQDLAETLAVQISVEIAAALDRDVLTPALERSLAVARLAVPSIGQ